MNLFITGTDTGAGKTHTAVQIVRLLRESGARAAGFKPICCGDRDDARALLQASGKGFSIDEINPVWLKTPAAPLVASRAERTVIDIDAIVRAFGALCQRVDHVIVEGVGGWLVPIRRDYFVSDMAVQLGMPVLIVARNRLGCLNHSSLTIRSVKESGAPIAGIVLNSGGSSADASCATNTETLQALFPEVVLLPELSAETGELPPEWRLIFRKS